MSSTHIKHHRHGSRRVISPSYDLIISGGCTVCKQRNHETAYCPSLRRKKMKTLIERNNPSLPPQFLLPQQIFHGSFGNHPPMPTQPGATSQCFIMSPQSPSPEMYSSEDIFGVAKHSDVPDLDFPSLAGHSLDNCLLNSPLQTNPKVAFPSIYPAPPPQAQVSQQTSQKNKTHKSHSTSGQQTQPPTKILPLCSTTSIPSLNSGEGTSYYDEATWSDQLGYSFPSTNGD